MSPDPPVSTAVVRVAPKIFRTRDGNKIMFFVDVAEIPSDLRNERLRQIRARGGEITGRAADASIIIVRDGEGDGQLLARHWSGAPGKVVLGLAWVSQCVREELFFGSELNWGGHQIQVTSGRIRSQADQQNEDSEYYGIDDEDAQQADNSDLAPPRQKKRPPSVQPAVVNSSHGPPAPVASTSQSSTAGQDMSSLPLGLQFPMLFDSIPKSYSTHTSTASVTSDTLTHTRDSSRLPNTSYVKPTAFASKTHRTDNTRPTHMHAPNTNLSTSMGPTSSLLSQQHRTAAKDNVPPPFRHSNPPTLPTTQKDSRSLPVPSSSITNSRPLAITSRSTDEYLTSQQQAPKSLFSAPYANRYGINHAGLSQDPHRTLAGPSQPRPQLEMQPARASSSTYRNPPSLISPVPSRTVLTQPPTPQQSSSNRVSEGMRNDYRTSSKFALNQADETRLQQAPSDFVSSSQDEAPRPIPPVESRSQVFVSPSGRVTPVTVGSMSPTSTESPSMALNTKLRSFRLNDTPGAAPPLTASGFSPPEPAREPVTPTASSSTKRHRDHSQHVPDSLPEPKRRKMSEIVDKTRLSSPSRSVDDKKPLQTPDRPGTQAGSSSRLFTFPDGTSYQFWIEPALKNRSIYKNLCKAHGGDIVSQISDCNFVILSIQGAKSAKDPSIKVLQRALIERKTVLKPKWIGVSVENGRLAPTGEHSLGESDIPHTTRKPRKQ